MDSEKQITQEPIVSDDEMKMPESAIPSLETNEKGTHLVAILGILIVILVLILAGLYIWGSTLQDTTHVTTDESVRPTAAENNEPESTNAEAEVETFGALSTSNEIEALEADIESTNLEALDAELDAIDAELDAALEEN